jgi:hypothetical protein
MQIIHNYCGIYVEMGWSSGSGNLGDKDGTCIGEGNSNYRQKTFGIVCDKESANVNLNEFTK